ncbi:MAG: Crp/Fnr family transcriptional regulator [Candidatus Omnitrophica bacterium]|nr:Crp/Fnr family transcriptional regulator [Candidatus Omnitrophota bacterium]
MDDILAQVPLFRTLPQTELKDLAAACELRRFHKGETIFAEGQPAEAVWIVKRGWVSLVKGTPHGGPATIFAMTPAEPLCGISAFEHGTYSASAVASTDTQLIKVPVDVFSRLLDRYPALARQVLAICCQRIRRMAEAISLAQAPVEQRIAYVLLRLRRTFGKTIPMTHQELAGMVGTRWETSIRTLSAMKRRGWVASSRGRMTVLAPRKLQVLIANGKPVPPSSNGFGHKDADASV